MRVVVAQKGAREHFLAARSFQRFNSLSQLVVDWYSPCPSVPKLIVKNGGKALIRAFGVYSPSLPSNKIKALRFWGMISRIRMKYFCGHDFYAVQLADDISFGKKLCKVDLPEHDTFFGYSYASLEILKKEKENGKFCIVDQIDPGKTWYQMIAEEIDKWPTYSNTIKNIMPPEEYFERAKAEQELADLVVVNSEWTLKCLLSDGFFPINKVAVLPLAFELKQDVLELLCNSSKKTGGKLSVLWVGNVSLGKGIQYLVEAAEILSGENIEFLVAGPIKIHENACLTAPKNVQWLGQVPQTEISSLYRKSDVFILPTLSDGFAITQLEALAHGLPVIITPNCGSIIQDGEHGFIIPPADSKAIAQAIYRFVKEPTLVQDMRSACKTRAKEFSVQHYAEQLIQAINNIKEGRCLA